ncbi:hypothetical protein LOTGIDRAFT_222639 [Lottia gigantea]|uniref:Small integral membrane protein 12 n=1 Tax=Lottia gigantea TaxID=225164 RepID=V4B537_LOTGI|nr:hypothetical protein LOTGIDRAFT_222639 [Lottia gigantea]ESO83574.1 hypothetical protein LOTGIDRAFT_222639 [Lottia gigantea]
MWPIIMAFARSYAVYIAWPVAAVVGFVGYNFESVIRKDKNTPWKVKSIQEERDERILKDVSNKDCTEVDSLKEKRFVPKTILGRNDS